MQNPFEYGGVVGQQAFCNRKWELAEIYRICENAEKMFLYSERRLGKTSLLKLALTKLPKKTFLLDFKKPSSMKKYFSFEDPPATANMQAAGNIIPKSGDW